MLLIVEKKRKKVYNLNAFRHLQLIGLVKLQLNKEQEGRGE